MFKNLIDLINQYKLENQNILIDSINQENNDKLSIVFTKNTDKMYSIELLFNGICDFMIIDLQTEQIIYSKTIQIDTIEKSEEILKYFLQVKV